MADDRLSEPGGDLDCADPNATAFNRAACGMIDQPSERELGPIDVLAVIAAEAIAQGEFLRWLGMETW